MTLPALRLRTPNDWLVVTIMFVADNGHGDAESADSRTSQSDSLTSKPAPSSENAITSDSSRLVHFYKFVVGALSLQESIFKNLCYGY
jgi:hypothetical protein